jgi:hypothetical protein
MMPHSRVHSRRLTCSLLRSVLVCHQILLLRRRHNDVQDVNCRLLRMASRGEVLGSWPRAGSSNPEVQAQNIQMCKLEITLERRSPDMDAIKASSALRLGLRIARRFGPSSRRIAPSCRSRRWTWSLEDRRSSLGCSIVRHVL